MLNTRANWWRILYPGVRSVDAIAIAGDEVTGMTRLGSGLCCKAAKIWARGCGQLFGQEIN
jgi:hypothetical protein